MQKMMDLTNGKFFSHFVDVSHAQKRPENFFYFFALKSEIFPAFFENLNFDFFIKSSRIEEKIVIFTLIVHNSVKIHRTAISKMDS